ncbi:hypothetical protein LUZ61_004043 [Rhynchospora tenuis]|uniref:Vesicle transport v-SNARE N-terminal domain-containing protein n=1 Tax=Rhynchospora tenuis TaxID=198213 RepID=A0AAD5ZM37_9POAL|nr:hypothetical protein LUZ61_004043 [Rhynchospora tenuis]
MDVEARSLQPSVRAGFLVKLREYKPDMTNIKNEVKRINISNSKKVTREEFLESGMADSFAVTSDQRGTVLMSTERLAQSSDGIKESRRVAPETEVLGSSILQDLHNQRQSLLHAHNSVCFTLSSFIWT